MKKQKQAGKIGNQNAAKSPDLRRTSLLQIPVTPKEKAKIVKEAKGKKLTDHCRKKLGIKTKAKK